jgi:hypothetical protein
MAKLDHVVFVCVILTKAKPPPLMAANTDFALNALKSGQNEKTPVRCARIAFLASSDAASVERDKNIQKR